MFKRISETLNVDLTGVPAIGDSLRDLQACAALGCQPMLVLTGKGEKTLGRGQSAGGHAGIRRSGRRGRSLLAKEKK
jgi:D-glycero-D-manno-heptose 1,7-bisphosphate phosphatase